MVTTTRDEEFRAYVLASRGQLVRTATLLASGDRFAAEDLVQTALMRLYVAWPRVRTETVDAYTRKSLLNALIDDRRRAFTRHERTQAQLPDVGIDDRPPSETETAVFAALAALPPRMRAAVVLRHLCELSVCETAAALGCSEGNVKSQTARGLASLRSALRPEHPQGPEDQRGHQDPRDRQIPSPPGLLTEPVASVDLRHAEDTVRTPYHRGSDE